MDEPRQPPPGWADDPGPGPGAPHAGFRELRDALGSAGAGHGGEQQCLDFCPICRAADALRTALPPEAQEHWQSLQREMAFVLRAALDHYLTRQPPPDAEVQVEDIPID
ncbi:MAG: hypothetical protein ACR2NA_05905 [Solirubrobacterales bacterium]